MSKFDVFAHRAAHLAQSVGHRAADFASDIGQRASNLGQGFKGGLPEAAIKWMETGAALAAMRTGSKAATGFVRRHPALTVAAVAGAGLLLYAASKRRAKRRALEAQGIGQVIEGEVRQPRDYADGE